MSEKRSLLLLSFVAILFGLFLEPAWAQGSYDPGVAARFVGVWLNLKTGSNWAVIEAGPTSASVKGCAGSLTNCSIPTVSFTRGEKLVSSYRIYARDYPTWNYPTGWSAQVETELSILSNGHMGSVITERYSFGKVDQRTAEYEKVKSLTTSQPAMPVQPAKIGGIPNCLEMGYERGIIPQAMAAETLWCTKYVYNLSQRKDLKDCWNGSYPDAYLWDDWAREKDGRSRGCNFTVSPKDKNQSFSVNEVKTGDVAVWEPWCNGAKELGHVAYVTAVHRESGTVDIDEANWPEGRGEGHRNGVKIEQCMSFIHQKSSEQPTAGPELSLWDRFLQLIRSCFGFCR